MAKKIETKAVHAGHQGDPGTGAIMTPIFQNSTYKQDAVGKTRGYEYSRTGNPTRTALEQCLADTEEAKFGLAFASGMSATDTVLRLLNPGDHVVAGDDAYGGSFRLFNEVLSRFGLEFDYVDTSDLDQVQAALRPETRLLWLETPTNPLMEIADIAAISEILKAHPSKALLAVDNTFATPYLQQPLTLGADFVVHSTTKYLGGHSDVVGGAVLLNDKDNYERLAFLQNAVGAVPGPMDCFLVLRGLKTLHVRMDRHAENASAIADYLAGHPKIEKIYYPFHSSHPHVELAKRQMRNGGGMISFDLKDGEKAALKVAETTKIFSLAESLGGVESLIEVPAIMTHLSIADSAMAIDPGLVRISVGIEHVDDLLEDIEQALKKA
jgi:cystathionine beta-lyase/cystathionine gamma-synthase